MARGGTDAWHPPLCVDVRKGCDVLRRKQLGGATACVLVTVLAISSTVAAATTHKVRSGETLWSLAKKYRTTPKAITQANHMSENSVLALGKTLTIPETTGSSTPSLRSYNRSGEVNRGAGALIHTRVADTCLRCGPSTGSSKVAVLRQGTTLTLVSTQGNWAKVALSNGVRGFVYRPLLAPGAGSASGSNQAATAASSTDRNSDLVQTALSCRGARYARGGTSRGGFDCSGFTRYVYAKYGVSLPHSSAAQARLGTPVAKSELRPGDLVFFQTYRRGISHVGIYIGDTKFVHAATHGRGVTVDSLNSSYYSPRYRGARRVRG